MGYNLWNTGKIVLDWTTSQLRGQCTGHVRFQMVALWNIWNKLVLLHRTQKQEWYTGLSCREWRSNNPFTHNIVHRPDLVLTGGWIQMHTEEPHDICTWNITSMTKSGSMRWVVHVACIGNKRNAYIKVHKSEWNGAAWPNEAQIRGKS
jgi:hypothetical protein